MQALLLFKIRNPEITATEERVHFSQLSRDGAASHHVGPRGKHQGESGDRRSEESMVQSLCSGFCEMKISPAILTNRRYHSHQGFLPSKCKWRLSKCSQNWSSRYCHYHHLPTTVIPEEFRGMQETRETRKQDWPQIAEVHMKGMDSVSQGACIFPYTEC